MCCNKPCLIGAWERGRYGLLCINCGAFREG